SRDPREDGRGHVHADVHARGRGVVLVDHQAVEARLIRRLVLVEIALVVPGGDLRIEETVRELEAERGVLVALGVGELVMRHLAEVVELHERTGPFRKSVTRRANASGCSMGGRCPQCSSTDSVALGRSRRYCSPQITGAILSWRPQTISVRLST